MHVLRSGKVMKAGDLVQVLPGKVGYYIVIGRTRMADDYVGRKVYWDLYPLPTMPETHRYLGPMNEKFIEVVSESR